MKLRKFLVMMLACLTFGAVGVGMASCVSPDVGGDNSTNSSSPLPNDGNNGGITPPTPDDGDAVTKKPSEGLAYTLSYDETYYKVQGIGTCTDTDIVIPTTYKDLPVASIGSHAFAGCSSLTTIEIPDSVTSIENGAFYNCSSLTNIAVLADNANYKSIDGNLYTKDGKTLIQYAIGKPATSFIVPDSLTSIGSDAFRGCKNLTSVIIPDGVTSIGDGAFCNCRSLTSIEIPESVTSSGNYAFSGCTSLTNIAVLANNANYKSVDGNLYTKDGKTLIQYAIGKKATSFTILDGVTTIGDGAFGACSSLTSIEIPDSVTSIGDETFYGCSSLTSIEIPDSVTSIGSGAFGVCSSLTSIEIPDSVTWIGTFAFAECSSLTSVVLGDGVEGIGSYAFDGCSSVTTIVIGENVVSIADELFYPCYRLWRVYYKGAVENWTTIYDGNIITSSMVYYYIENEADVPMDGGNYWHYDKSGIVAIW